MEGEIGANHFDTASYVEKESAIELLIELMGNCNELVCAKNNESLFSLFLFSVFYFRGKCTMFHFSLCANILKDSG